MPDTDIVIQGAREHNLQNVSLTIPSNQLVVMTGVSGSGKSSLAFDTLYAEGQRRYVESLSSYARQFLGQMSKPDVDSITGIAPSISIQQKTSGRNPRSTVGTITEIYDYLRVLFARVGQGHCATCGVPITAQSREQILDAISQLAEGTRFQVLAPVVQLQKGHYRDLFEDLLKQGFLRARVDGQFVSLSQDLQLDRQMKHTIDVVVDRLIAGTGTRARLAEAVELALRLGKGRLIVATESEKGPLAESVGTSEEPALGAMPASSTQRSRRKKGPPGEPIDAEAAPGGRAAPTTTDRVYSADYACPKCQKSYEPPSPQLFSFNSPLGMCTTCDGLGEKYDFDLDKLIGDPSRTFAQGVIELIGSLKDMGRWRRHLYEGIARAIEIDLELDEGSVLHTPWSALSDAVRERLLYGLGDRNITFAWRHRGGVWKHGGTFAGVLAELMESYKSAKNPMRRRQLEKFMQTTRCRTCAGSRLNPQASHVTLTSRSFHATTTPATNDATPQTSGTAATAKRGAGRAAKAKSAASRSAPVAPSVTSATLPAPEPVRLSLPRVCGLTIAEADAFFRELVLDPTQAHIAAEVLKEIRTRLGFLLRCGLDYLALDRTAPTLSGGESQRIRLAGQIGSGLVGVVYILDEPSIGLHPRDNEMLLRSLLDLRDLGNTVVVVEHDEETMRAADHIIDFGPGPGVLGGEVVARGTFADIVREPRSLTGQYLGGTKSIPVRPRRTRGTKAVTVRKASHNNLKDVTVDFPLEAFVCVTGVSGSGKSSLVNDILWEGLSLHLNGAEGAPGAHKELTGLEHLDKAINIDQSPIGRTPRSNPATYVKLFDEIRDLYAQLPDSKVRGYGPGRFSFNVEGGRCEACEGNGATKLEMDFLADIWVTCPVCSGQRFHHETLQVRFKDKSIAEVLDMDVQQALAHFENVSKIANLLRTLRDVGLEYMKLGQPSPTLSGGEAQRVKLARELGKRATGRTVYLLDEPTTGLHFADVHKLLDVLHGFVDAGNTVIVVEHNLDVIKTADWVIDLGPEGGAGGGRIVVAGTPEQVAQCETSHTGRALRMLLATDASRPAAAAAGRLTPSDAVPATTKPGRSRSRTAAAAARLLPAGAVTTGARLLDPLADRSLAAHAATSNVGATATPSSPTPAVPHRAAGLSHITIKGAAQHNLQKIDVTLPRRAMSVFCGPSGSGKSSLAMDTLYAEGQRRYVESLSSYARQFLGQMPKPKVEHISGLSPAIAIEQKTVGHSPRSTVGTVTELHDYLRVLFARLGRSYCPDCQLPVDTQTTDQVIDSVLQLPPGTRVLVLAPRDVPVGESYDAVWGRLRQDGYRRVRLDGVTYTLEQAPEVDRRRKHALEIVIDRVTISHAATGRSRLAGSIETALGLGRGWVHIAHVHETVPETEWRVDRYSLHKACPGCGRSFDELTPNQFSFNSPLGWCPSCEGLGVQSGTNLHALVDSTRSLAEGAVPLWRSCGDGAASPDLGSGEAVTAGDVTTGSATAKTAADADPRNPFPRMLRTITAQMGIPLDVPFARLDPRHQRVLLYGTGERWFGDSAVAGAEPLGFRFQYKGLYPAFEEAMRASPSYRISLDHLAGETACSVCLGSRLRDDSAAVRFRDRTLGELSALPLGELVHFLAETKLSAADKKVAGEVLFEMSHRLQFLVDVGLDYLTLDRPMPTLSGGESQRIRLAGQVARALTGVVYVLDEPTIGLHPRDTSRLLAALRKLRDLGNTLVLVEHDREVLDAADRLYDFGPGAGRFGGQITGEGTVAELVGQEKSLTGKYLGHREEIPLPLERRMPSGHPWTRAVNRLAPSTHTHPVGIAAEVVTAVPRKTPRKAATKSVKKAARDANEAVAGEVARTTNPGGEVALPPSPGKSWIELLGCRLHNLKNVDLRIPVGTLTCVTGASGSGKSSLIEGTLAKAVARQLHQAREIAGPHDALRGLDAIRKVIVVDQQPLGSTPASNPATYTGLFDLIRELFTRMPEARVRGYRATRFSFNRSGGRCDACEGLGQRCIEMHFLPDVWVECDTCKGRRFNPETLAIRYRGHSIADVLEMSIGKAAEVFDNIPKIRAILATLCAVGLDYLTLGQSAGTLSGGEAQRVKLAAELARPQSGQTLYLLDEPTTGLHFDDIRKLLKVLNSLVDLGNTVVVIEHNLDVIKTADWVIDVGPDAGQRGGEIVAQGTPEDLAEYAEGLSGKGREPASRPHSDTADYLLPLLRTNRRAEREVFDVQAAAQKQAGDVDLLKIGKEAKLPWQTDGRGWHTRDRIAHNGKPARWEGSALALVIDHIEAQGGLASTLWNERSVVEIAGLNTPNHWFLHALTGDEWLLTLKFRVHRNTFQVEPLSEMLGLRSLDDLDELPIYGRADRVRVKNLDAVWQEATVSVHWLSEIDTRAFRQFLDDAIHGYLKGAARVKRSS